jgi:hypothetical protein
MPTRSSLSDGSGHKVSLYAVFASEKVILNPEQRFDITPAMCHAKNQHVLILETMDDDVLASGKTPRTKTKVVVPGSAQVGMAGKKQKTVGNGMNQAIGYFDAAAVIGDVVPDFI